MNKMIWKKAFIKSIPILFSYLFVGAAYGMMMQQAGFSWYISLFASAAIYTGAFQFVLITFLSSSASMWTIGVTAFLMSSRQTFYSLTFLDELKNSGKKKLLLTHCMTDETYAVHCTLMETGSEKRNIMFGVEVFSWFYWAVGAVFGSVAGQLIPADMQGIDFCMTALFVTIFIDQWEKNKQHMPALAGIFFAVVCLTLFGPSNFMLPALLLVSFLLLVMGAGKKEAETDGY